MPPQELQSAASENRPRERTGRGLADARPRRFQAPQVIFWTALGLRLACILIGHTYRIRLNDRHFDFGFEAGRIAEALVTGQGYANPFNGPSGPTAWLPPVYPLMMALAFRLFGIYTRGAAFFLLGINSVFSALICPAVYEMAARCFDARGLGRRGARSATPVALWSAWMWAVYPAALQYAIHWIWEMSVSTCLLAWALVVALRLRRVGEPNAGDAAGMDRLPLWLALGALWGLLALSNASLLLVFPASLLWILWPALRRGLRQVRATPLFAGPLAAVLVFLALLMPWIVRNERALHAFIPTRDNFGVELWQSSHLALYGPFPWGTAMPLNPGDPEFRRYVAMGEAAYAKEKGEEGRRRLLADPGTVARFTLLRAQMFWFGVPHPEDKHPAGEFVRILNFAFTSLAGLMGLGLALRRRVPGAWLFAAVFGLVPVAYYLVTVQARFRHPIEPLITICAVYLFRSTRRRRTAERADAEPPLSDTAAA